MFSMCIRIYVHMYAHILSIYLSVGLSVYLPTYLSVYSVWREAKFSQEQSCQLLFTWVQMALAKSKLAETQLFCRQCLSQAGFRV